MIAWVSIIKINNGIKEPIHGYQICTTSQMSIFGGDVKIRESLYTRVIIWLNIILNQIDTKEILPTYEGSNVDPLLSKTKIPSITHTLVVSKIMKNQIPECDQKQDKTSPTLVIKALINSPIILS